MITSLRVLAAMGGFALLLVAVAPGGSIGLTTATLGMLCLLPFAGVSAIWRHNAVASAALCLALLTNYILRMVLVSVDRDNFATFVPHVPIESALRVQTEVVGRLLLATALTLVVLGAFASRSRSTGSADPKHGLRASLRRPELILGAAFLSFVLTVVDPNRFAAGSAPLAIARAMIPGTSLLALIIYWRFVAGGSSRRMHRILELAGFLIVIGGILEGRQAAIVLPIALWVLLVAGNRAQGEVKLRRVFALGLGGAMLVVFGGVLVANAESGLRGSGGADERTSIDSVAAVSERLGTFDRESAVYSLAGGDAVSERIDPLGVGESVLSRTLPGVALSNSLSMGREFSLTVQRRPVTNRVEGAWGWVAGAVEVAGPFWWPLVIAFHVLVTRLIMLWLHRDPALHPIEAVVGLLLLAQWIPSGNLDRLWSTAIREVVLGVILAKLVTSVVDHSANEPSPESSSLGGMSEAIS